MKKSDFTLLNEALDCFLLNPGLSKTIITARYYGKDEIKITSKEKYNNFNQVITELLDGAPGKKISRGFLLEEVQDRIYLKLKSGERFTDLEAREFKSYIKNLPVKQVRVIREVQGATISDLSPPFRFGRFTFYDWKRHLHLIKSSADDDFSRSLLDRGEHTLVVECTVESHDEEKALELAELEFLRLEALVTFLIGNRGADYEFGIDNYQGLRNNQSYLIANGTIVYDFRTNGAFKPLEMDGDYFANPSPARAKLMALEETTANGLERKVLRSVEWISQAITELNPASSFMKAATALEVLFAINEKGVISSSLMAKFSEGCAQILGDSTEKCVLIEKDIKRLYSIRSAVVHSGKSDVSIGDLNSLIAYVRSVIFKILTHEKLSTLNSIEQLNEYLAERKYQGFGIIEN